MNVQPPNSSLISKSGKSWIQWKTSRPASIRSSSRARCKRSSPSTRLTTASSSATNSAVASSGTPNACSLERGGDACLHHVEHILALDERHLEVKLAKLELTVGAEIFVPPAGRDLVVAVDPAHHAELLEQLGRLGEGEKAPRLESNGHEEVARPLGRAAGHAWRPDIDEVPLVHDMADRRDRGVVEPEVALHPLCTH